MLGLGFDQPQGFRNWPTTARDHYVRYIPQSGFVGHSIKKCLRDSDLCMASAETSFGSSGREGPARPGIAGEVLPIVIHYEEHAAPGRGHGQTTGGNCSVHGADSGS
ncbi:hypothetical protein B0H14DRAFT_2628815 [Mycena olivaceomarginata]|nr:hypothetical protein B0H14DRAFT_2628815 [Mycena olivaceomarginata]